MAVYDLFFDGACSKEKYRTASFGFVLNLNGKEIDHGWGLIGQSGNMTDLMAELRGLSAGLDSFVSHWNQPKPRLTIYGDCKPALNRAQKGFDPIIKFKLDQIRKAGIVVQIRWIPRRLNVVANDLAKKLISTGC